MAKYTVVTMPGDGIGNVVLAEALRLLRLGVLEERGQRPA
jgi:isocitrate/isopropylmalate dehydrogenase